MSLSIQDELGKECERLRAEVRRLQGTEKRFVWALFYPSRAIKGVFGNLEQAVAARAANALGPEAFEIEQFQVWDEDCR